jgi:Na+-translocating ferredoxin:NAD+ oxidoreductase subunit G
MRAVVVALVLLVASQAGAVKYLSIGQAVKTWIPEDAKIFKVTKKLSAEQKQRLVEDYGWTPKDEEYVFYVGKRGETVVAYVFVVPEIFNTCFHSYAVGMTPEGKVLETVITELTCPRSFPINRKSFLGQFSDKRHVDPLTIHADVDAVTGATLSSEATASATRKAVSLHNLFFGGAQPVAVAQNVKDARAKAAGLIQKAIDTGETLAKEGKEGGAQLPPQK